MRAIITGILLTLVLAAPAAACEKPPIYDPHASVSVCGDPRAYIALDNTDSNRPVDFRVVFWTPRTDIRHTFVKEVPAGESRMLVRWVRSVGLGGALRKVSVYARVRIGTGNGGEMTWAMKWELLARVTVKTAHGGRCPAFVYPS